MPLTDGSTADVKMRWFGRRQVRAAVEWAAGGGQSLHDSQRHLVPGSISPVPCAHLFDQDRERLVHTAQILGVRRVLVKNVGRPRQHVDLWSGPLRAAHEIAHEEGGT